MKAETVQLKIRTLNDTLAKTVVENQALGKIMLRGNKIGDYPPARVLDFIIETNLILEEISNLFEEGEMLDLAKNKMVGENIKDKINSAKMFVENSMFIPHYENRISALEDYFENLPQEEIDEYHRKKASDLIHEEDLEN